MVDHEATALKTHVVEHLDSVAKYCGVDIFLLGPKFTTSSAASINGDAGQDQRWRVAVYGDMESTEHAKSRVLIFIDRLVSLNDHFDAHIEKLLLTFGSSVERSMLCF